MRDLSPKLSDFHLPRRHRWFSLHALVLAVGVTVLGTSATTIAVYDAMRPHQSLSLDEALLTSGAPTATEPARSRATVRVFEIARTAVRRLQELSEESNQVGERARAALDNLRQLLR